MALKYPDILRSNNPAAYGIVPANEVSGHKQVASFTELYALADPILSLSKVNTNNDAIGQLWYVASEGKHYQLVDWANRKNANGWKEFKSGGGGGTLKFSGFISEEIANIGDTCAAPTDIFFYTVEGMFIAKDANGYYYDWQGTDLIPSSEEYGTYESGINPHDDKTYLNSANGQLYLYDPNQSMILTRSTRPRVAYGTCSTAANVAEKIITLHSDFADWKLEVGAEFVVRFDTTNSATDITLNINGTGAKRVWYNQSMVSAVQVMICQMHRPERYMYDGANYVWMGHALDYYKDYTPKLLGFGYGICDTGTTATAKTATLAGYALIQHGIVSIKFTNSVPANATLNINSKGAKPIFYRGAKIVAGVINAGDVAMFIYDGTNYIYLGTDNALSRAGGKMTGGISWNTDDGVESTINADGYEYNSINVVSMDDDSDVVVTGDKIAKKGGTSDQVLMADGSVAGTITTDWLEANLT